MAETRQRKEFKKEIAKSRQIRNNPRNLGWEGHQATHLNDAPDTDGKRAKKAPTLRELDGDRDEG